MEADKLLPACFYRTISHPSNQPITISTQFMEKHGDSLGDCVFLKDSGPGETEWEVKLRGSEAAWLDKGWKEFVLFYSIKEDYLLIFEYQGHSRFLVSIFDKTCNEIVYPLSPPPEMLPVKEEPAEEDDDPVPLPIPVRKRNPTLDEECEDDDDPAPLPVKKRRGGRKTVEVSTTDVICEGTPDAPPRELYCAGRYSKLQGRAKLRAIEKDFTANSKHPCFAASLKPTYVSEPYSVHIPITFWRSNFAKCKIDDEGLVFKVRLSGQGTSLPVYVTEYGPGGGRMYGTGWRQFAGENRLACGELCIFEMLKKDKTFVVHRFQ